MKKKDTVKKMGDKSCLKVSDWVTFLSNEKHGMMSNVVNFSMLLVAVIALILATSGYTVFVVASVIIALGCVGWAYSKVLGPLHRRGNLADGILKRIISGELKDADGIREEWVLGLAVIRRGWLRQGKGRLAALKRAWRRQREAGLAALKETWSQEKARLVALKETWWRKWEAGLAALRETWSQEKARLVALTETSRRKWDAGLAALRETWSQEKARLVALTETRWHLW
jgi:hypothetical protein